MRRRLFRRVARLLIAIVILIGPAALSAQSLWLDRSHDQNLTLEAFKPSFKKSIWGSYRFYNGAWYPVDYSSFSAVVLFFSLRWPLGSKTLLVTELPFARAEFDTRIEDEFSLFHHSGYENTIGNPYLGLEIGSNTALTFAEVGIRLPLAAEENVYARAVGAGVDLDRLEAFSDDVSLKATANLRLRHAGFGLRIKSGLIAQFDNENPGHHILYVPYVARVGYESPRLSLGGSFVGRLALSINGDGSDAGTAHQLGFAASVGFGKLRPGIYFGLPLGDYYLTDSVFGLNLGITMAKAQPQEYESERVKVDHPERKYRILASGSYFAGSGPHGLSWLSAGYSRELRSSYSLDLELGYGLDSFAGFYSAQASSINGTTYGEGLFGWHGVSTQELFVVTSRLNRRLFYASPAGGYAFLGLGFFRIGTDYSWGVQGVSSSYDNLGHETFLAMPFGVSIRLFDRQPASLQLDFGGMLTTLKFEKKFPQDIQFPPQNVTISEPFGMLASAKLRLYF